MNNTRNKLLSSIHAGTARKYTTSAAPDLKPIDSRWLSQTTSRIGKCMSFGLSDEQSREAGSICEEIATSWRDLSAGSEGYLTGKGRRGLWKHKVVWGYYYLLSIVADHAYTKTGHVNNVVYVRYAESARVEWAANYARSIDPANRKQWEEIWSSRGIGMILRSIKTDFKFPMTYPDRVSVFHKLRTLPEADHDAFVLDVLMLSERHRRPVARCVEDIVMYDYRAAKKANLGQTPFMLDAFRDTFRLQEEARRTNCERAQALSERVRALETSSWDRDGAVEDLGSAKQ